MKISEKITLRFEWFVKRNSAKKQIRRRRQWDDKIRKSLNKQQLETFELVEQLSSDYPESIMYDKYSDFEETMIRLPHLLVTMSDYTVHVNNTTGFNPASLPKPAYNHLMNIVDRNAHRYRRGLRYETQSNISAFIKKTREEHKK